MNEDEQIPSEIIPVVVREAAERLARVVQEHLGTVSGQTALYWRLLHVIRQHAKRETL